VTRRLTVKSISGTVFGGKGMRFIFG